jgi:hypothetical protein
MGLRARGSRAVVPHLRSLYFLINPLKQGVTVQAVCRRHRGLVLRHPGRRLPSTIISIDKRAGTGEYLYVFLVELAAYDLNGR